MEFKTLRWSLNAARVDETDNNQALFGNEVHAATKTAYSLWIKTETTSAGEKKGSTVHVYVAKPDIEKEAKKSCWWMWTAKPKNTPPPHSNSTGPVAKLNQTRSVNAHAIWKGLADLIIKELYGSSYRIHYMDEVMREKTWESTNPKLPNIF